MFNIYRNLFIEYQGDKLFDDIDNTPELLLGLPTARRLVCGDIVYVNSDDICIPARIYDYILRYGIVPKITCTVRRKCKVNTELSLINVDSSGRFLTYHKNISSVIKKYPEYNRDAILQVIDSGGKMYGKYWCWDYMFYVRMELLQRGHVR